MTAPVKDITTAQMPPQWFAGLMTGTVLDGNIDVAFLRTDGVEITEFGAFELIPYTPVSYTHLRAHET